VPSVNVGREDSGETAIRVRARGAGRRTVLVCGYRLDGDSWGAVAST
jgi:hypothetical protein